LGFDDISQVRPKGKADVSAKYKEDHMVLFERYGMKWPCSVDPIQIIDDIQCFFGGMGVRQVEMTILLHTHYPAVHEVEFLDVNPSLNQLTAFKQGDDGLRPSSPWKPVPGTLVGSSFIVMRCQAAGYLRSLTGFEYMQLIGWDTTEWVTSRPFNAASPMPQHSLCSELAGNAFSAFVMSPLVATLLACSGATRQLREEMEIAKSEKVCLKRRILTGHASCSSVGGSDVGSDC
jgi:hypothetical protein